VPDDELREQHRDDVVVPACVELLDVAEDAARQLAVGRIDDLERYVNLEF